MSNRRLSVNHLYGFRTFRNFFVQAAKESSSANSAGVNKPRRPSHGDTTRESHVCPSHESHVCPSHATCVSESQEGWPSDLRSCVRVTSPCVQVVAVKIDMCVRVTSHMCVRVTSQHVCPSHKPCVRVTSLCVRVTSHNTRVTCVSESQAKLWLSKSTCVSESQANMCVRVTSCKPHVCPSHKPTCVSESQATTRESHVCPSHRVTCI